MLCIDFALFWVLIDLFVPVEDMNLSLISTKPNSWRMIHILQLDVFPENATREESFHFT